MSRLQRLFHLRLWGPRLDEGVRWEIEHHLAERIDELMAGGMSRAAAVEEAERTFGDVGRVEREMMMIERRMERRRHMSGFLDDLVQDVRYGLRSIRLHAGISAAIILTLALGIGANAAMFSVIDALLLRPLPYAAPDELVDVVVAPPEAGRGMPQLPLEVARTWYEAQDRPSMLHVRRTTLYTGGQQAENVALQAVTPEFNDVFGVQPALGRGFIQADAEAGSPDVVLLDHTFWRTRLGGDMSVLGDEIIFAGIPHTVIGVMPEDFRYPTYSTTAGWIPLRLDGTLFGQPLRGRTEAVVRVPVDAQGRYAAELAALGANLNNGAGVPGGMTLRVQAIDWLRVPSEDLARALMLVSGAVVLILLVAGVNMMNLLLSRGAARANEMAIRMAVGARRGRIIRQIATEAMLLALLGGVAAAAVSVIVLHGLQGIIPDTITFRAPYAITYDSRALLFTFAVAVVSGFAFGMLPAFTTSSWAQSSASGAFTRYATRTPAKRRLRRVLVVSEVAFSVMLLITAALLITSFLRLMRTEPGMRLENLAVLVFSPAASAYPDDAARGAHLRRIEERIAALPGVESTTLTGGLPPNTSFHWGVTLEAEGSAPTETASGMMLPFTAVRSDFFEVTGARLVAGRPFNRTDTRDSKNVIIDEDLARHLWPGGSAVGRRFRTDPADEWQTVIGVMADLRLMGPDERNREFAILRPLGEYEQAGGQLALAIRTRGSPSRVLPSIRDAVRAVDPDQPILELLPATSYYAEAVDMPRFLALLIGILAALALVLAAVGVHGVLAFGVTQRRHELGIRLALGARAAQLGGIVVREGVVLAAIGAAIGTAGALMATRIVQSALYGTAANDPIVYGATAALMLLVAAVATLRPAWRATALDPAEVLRTS